MTVTGQEAAEGQDRGVETHGNRKWPEHRWEGPLGVPCQIRTAMAHFILIPLTVMLHRVLEILAQPFINYSHNIQV